MAYSTLYQERFAGERCPPLDQMKPYDPVTNTGNVIYREEDGYLPEGVRKDFFKTLGSIGNDQQKGQFSSFYSRRVNFQTNGREVSYRPKSNQRTSQQIAIDAKKQTLSILSTDTEFINGAQGDSKMTFRYEYLNDGKEIRLTRLDPTTSGPNSMAKATNLICQNKNYLLIQCHDPKTKEGLSLSYSGGYAPDGTPPHLSFGYSIPLDGQEKNVLYSHSYSWPHEYNRQIQRGGR